MRNQYDARCHDCGYWVLEGKGTIEKVFGRWLVKHDHCPAEAIQAQRQKEAQADTWMKQQEARIERAVRNDPKAMAYLASKGIRL